VNFFGHAAVASWYVAPPARAKAALGAMLPDFQTMAGTRAVTVDDAEVAAGVAFHHRTDGAFHQLPVVSGLMRELHDQLRTAGVSRGPARAASHTGVELLLDGILIDTAEHRDVYLEALAIDPVPATFDAPERMAHLLARLRAHGVPFDLRRADAITHRIVRMISDRPLLAAKGEEPERIRGVLAAYRARIEVAAPTVMTALRAALDAPAAQPAQTSI
jgi:hypothetical protein